MYHFDNGYDAHVECVNPSGSMECSIRVTGNDTDVKIVYLSMTECADTLVRIRDQRASEK